MENGKDDRFRIVLFEEKYLPRLKELIHDGWDSNHVLLKSDALLRWHYTGFGRKAGLHMPLVFDGDEMIGYRLMTPIEIMLSDKHGNHQTITSSASSLYYVDPRYRGMKLGVKLERHVIEYYGGYFTTAANPVTAVPILKRSGTVMIDTMLRHFRPLSDDISPLMTRKGGHEWKFVQPRSVAVPTQLDPQSAALFWQKSVEGVNVTALNRSVAFWQWRYLEDPVYKYHCFSDESGLVIARICRLYDEERKRTENFVLRLLEVIPSYRQVWSGASDSRLSSLVDSVCGWGRENGCLAAEFYTATSHFNAVMEAAGFEEINLDESLADSIVSYYEPSTPEHRLSNVGIQSPYVPGDFDFENSYFTLADADQDRANILPQ